MHPLSICKVVFQGHGMKLVHVSTAVNEIQPNKYWMHVPYSHTLEVIHVSWDAKAAMHTMRRESDSLGIPFDPLQFCLETFTRVMENVSKDTFK